MSRRRSEEPFPGYNRMVRDSDRAYRRIARAISRVVDVFDEYPVSLGSGDDGYDLGNMVVTEYYKRHPNEDPALRRQNLPKRRKSPSSMQTLRLLGISCVKCGSKDRVVLDHITPVAHGGEYVEGNVQPLCWKCNREKAAK